MANRSGAASVTPAVIGIEEAREKARDVVTEIKTGVRQPGAAPESVRRDRAEYLRRDVMKGGLISVAEVHRSLDNHILPAWATGS